MLRITLAMGLAFGPALMPCAAALPPTPMFDTLGVEAGLPTTQVYALAQDRDGHLWVATGDGLARYDGVGFTVYRHDPGDPGSLPANNVQTVYVDREDRVWAGTEGGGLAMLDPARAHFRRWRGGGSPDGFSGDDVWSITQSRDGAIWAGTYGAGLNRLDPATGAVRVLRHDDGDPGSIASDDVIALVEDAQGRLLVATSGGLTVFDAAPGATGTPAARQLFTGQMISTVRASADGDAWFAARDALYRMRPGRNEAEPYAPAQTGFVFGVHRDRAGRLWLASHQGIALEHDGMLHAFRPGDPRRHMLTAPGVRDLLEDR